MGVEEKARQMASLLQEIALDAQTASLALKGFIPFSTDPPKQQRYREFLERNAGLRAADSLSLAEKPFDHLVELREFAKAAKIFKPLTSMMAARFTTSSQLVEEEKSMIPKTGLFIPDPKASAEEDQCLLIYGHSC